MNLEDSIDQDRIFLARLQHKLMIEARLSRLTLNFEDFRTFVKLIVLIQLNATWSGLKLTAEQSYLWIVENPLVIQNLEWVRQFPIFEN